MENVSSGMCYFRGEGVGRGFDVLKDRYAFIFRVKRSKGGIAAV